MLSLPVALWWQHQNIYDWWRLRDYTPSPAVATLATTTTMNDYGRKIFYVYNPQLDSKDNFRQDCSDSEKTIVLGCYKSNQGIYILDVQDDRLKGVREVTAAHEMLHAAYQRLSSSEKKRVDDLTQAAFANLSDERVKATIEQYRAKDPNVVPNELHSILGTEVRTLPPELETYYKRYFTNRLAIVTFSEQYEQEFTKRKDQIASYDKQLASLKKTIDQNQDDLNSQSTQLESERAQLESLLAADKRTEYNNAVSTFNAKVRAYNDLVRKTQAFITQYNQIVAQRNSVASEERDLVQAIDTRISTQATQ